MKKRKQQIIKTILSPGELGRRISLRLRKHKVLRSVQSGKGQLPYPSMIFATVNENCNLRCKMCELWGQDNDAYTYRHIKDKGDMPIALFKKLIDKVAFFKPEIFIVCTEPLIYPAIVEAINYVKSKGMRCQMTTNGVMLSRFSEALISSGIDQINISIDGGSARIHDEIRGVEGCFQRALSGVKKILSERRELKSKNPIIGTNTVITPYNYFQIFSQVEQFRKLDIDFINFTHLNFVTKKTAELHKKKYGDLHITESGLLNAGLREIDVSRLNQEIKQVKRYCKNLSVSFIPDIQDDELDKYYRHPESHISGFRRCFYPWRFSHVLPSGDVIVSLRCFNKVMGNINNQNFVDIWHGREYSAFREGLHEVSSFLPCFRCSGIFCSNYL